MAMESRGGGRSPDVGAPPLFESLLERGQLILLTGVGLVVAIAWVWLLTGGGIGHGGPMTADVPQAGVETGTGEDMAGMDMGSIRMGGMAMDAMARTPWTTSYAALIFSMWCVMMVAMMLPSATPTLLLFARVNNKEKAASRPYVFAAGYLLVWGLFSATATAAQWSLDLAGLLSPMMRTTTPWFGAGILIAAGLWQVTPIKNVCLRHCRSPWSFLVTGWRPGQLGALWMGMTHGLYCLGCCWFLMALLFFGGVMNLYWIIGLALFIAMEKVMPRGYWISRIAGVALITWGVLVLATTA